jgi:long-chain acyl-CoA synthetase
MVSPSSSPGLLTGLPGLRRLFRDNRAFEPAAPALSGSRGNALTYGELAEAVEHAAKVLAGFGAGPSVAVGVAVAEPCGFVIAALAAWECGAALLPLDARPGAEAWEAFGRRSKAPIVVTEASLDGALSVAFLEPPPSWTPLDRRCALLAFTSGASGPPKGVLLGRAGLIANVDAILGYLPLRTSRRTAVVLPLSYSYALVGQALAGLRAGAALWLLGDLPWPSRQLEEMTRAGVQGVSSVPSSLRLLARAALSAREAGAPVPPLDYLASAGSPLDARTLELLRRAFPGARLFNQYGLTEASPRIAFSSDAHPRFAQGALAPLPGISVWAEDGLGHALPAGQEGHLVVRSPSVMLGYLDEPGATAAALRKDGSLVTGDWGRVDADGCLFVSGRADGVVKVGGERVGVEGIAEKLRELPAVREAAVIALHDEVLGARLFAFIEGEAEAVEQAEDVARSLPSARQPACLLRLDKLPRTASGKPDLSALRELAARAAEDEHPR